MNDDFIRDDQWQRSVRDTVLAPGFYGPYAYEGRYVFIDKGRLASLLQKRYAVDTIVQGQQEGAAYCIEEKIVRWPGYDYRSICLETESCTVQDHESPGWMRYGQADFLLYAMMKPRALDVHLIDFPGLQAWFWPLESTFATFGMEHTLNHSRGRKVPLAAIRAAGLYVKFKRIFPDPSDPLHPVLFPLAQSFAGHSSNPLEKDVGGLRP